MWLLYLLFLLSFMLMTIVSNVSLDIHPSYATLFLSPHLLLRKHSQEELFSFNSERAGYFPWANTWFGPDHV